MAKFEMHVHTAECDMVAQVGAAEIVKLYHDAGYDGMVITDHYFSLFYEWYAIRHIFPESKYITAEQSPSAIKWLDCMQNIIARS